MSALLTTTLVGQRDVIDALKDAGDRDKYKVLIGGGATTQEWADTIGADGWAARHTRPSTSPPAGLRDPAPRHLTKRSTT